MNKIKVGDHIEFRCQLGKHYRVYEVDGAKFRLEDADQQYEFGHWFVAKAHIHHPAAAHKPLSPQAQVVLAHMKKAGSITQREAMADHSVQSLTKRISEMRDKGIEISREFRYHPLTGQRYARYSLV